MRQHYIVGTKLVETFSRGLFLLLSTYLLPLEEAGHFGLVSTIIGMLAFVLGYERYIDLQRQVAGRSPAAIRNRLRETLKFFMVHYVTVLPLLIAVLFIGLNWSIIESAILLIILVTEHTSNQSYHAVLLDKRAYPLMAAAAVKNAVQLLMVFLIAFVGDEAKAQTVLLMWAIVSGVYLCVAGFLWTLLLNKRLPEALDVLPPQSPSQQYRASVVHFLVGLVAVAALQVDRLVVGVSLSVSDVGVYFRNIALVALALQIFNIVSFNRVAPGVYKRAREGLFKDNSEIIWAEYFRFAVGLTSLVILFLVINHVLGSPASSLGIEAGFWIMLTCALLARTAADYAGLLLLSVGQDKVIFRNQLAAVFIGAAILWWLSEAFQLLGAFVGVMVTPMFYLLLNGLSMRQRFHKL